MRTPASATLFKLLFTHECTVLWPIFLAPTVRHASIPKGQLLRYVTYTTRSQSNNVEDGSIQTASDTLDGAAKLSLSPKRREPEAWVALVENFLPQSLRSTHKIGGSRSVGDTKHLPSLLSKARSTAPLRLDILSYMGINEGRWDAVRWVVEELAGRHQASSTSEECRMKKITVPWSFAEPNPYETTKLDELTEIPICFDVETTQSAEMSPARRTVRLGFESFSCHPEWLGQIWAMLAFMTLKAADYPTEDTSGQRIMSYVVEVIACLHHIDAVPRTIYTHSETSDASAGYKPATLSLMAYRVMMVLSDSAWKARDKQIRREAETIGVKDWYKGHEVPEPTLQPRIDGLGKEVWLDLILWCCVEGGYYKEASWVVTEMLKRKAGMTWKVIAWSEISRPEEPKLNWSARAELQIARAHITHVGPGFGIVGPSEVPPLVEMGSRTVSREVILALMDGLATSLRPPSEIQQQIVACRNLLNRKRSLTLETSTLNKAILGIFRLGLLDSDISAEVADRVFDLTSTLHGSNASPENPHILNQIHDEDNSAACLGLLHRVLYGHTTKGNIQAALRTFRKIQTIIDADRNRHIASFAEDLKHRERFGDPDQLISESINNTIPNVYPQIPPHILSAFLNLITDSHLYDLGDWLLYSDEVDGPFISPTLYSEVNLQSALLRFATATQNGQLFGRITEKLLAPLAPDILRTLLHCQITLGKWDAAEEVLRHFQAEPAMGWRDADIMVIARSILRLEHDVTLPPHALSRASTLLQDMLYGNFNRSRDPSKALDYSDHRRLTQMYRMLRTLPGSLQYVQEPSFAGNFRTNAPIEISVEAFNILLEGLVEARGSLIGQKLWMQWCRLSFDPNSAIEPGADPDREGLDVSDHDSRANPERVVTPTLQTLRVLMRPLVTKGKVNRTEEAELVKWAASVFRGFGLTDKEIEYELPGLWKVP